MAIQSIPSTQNIPLFFPSTKCALPTELAVHIFSYLTTNQDIARVTLVCKIWRAAVLAMNNPLAHIDSIRKIFASKKQIIDLHPRRTLYEQEKYVITPESLVSFRSSPFEIQFSELSQSRTLQFSHHPQSISEDVALTFFQKAIKKENSKFFFLKHGMLVANRVSELFPYGAVLEQILEGQNPAPPLVFGQESLQGLFYLPWNSNSPILADVFPGVSVKIVCDHIDTDPSLLAICTLGSRICGNDSDPDSLRIYEIQADCMRLKYHSTDESGYFPNIPERSPATYDLTNSGIFTENYLYLYHSTACPGIISEIRAYSLDREHLERVTFFRTWNLYPEPEKYIASSNYQFGQAHHENVLIYASLPGYFPPRLLIPTSEKLLFLSPPNIANNDLVKESSIAFSTKYITIIRSQLVFYEDEISNKTPIECYNAENGTFFFFIDYQSVKSWDSYRDGGIEYVSHRNAMTLIDTMDFLVVANLESIQIFYIPLQTKIFNLDNPDSLGFRLQGSIHASMDTQSIWIQNADRLIHWHLELPKDEGADQELEERPL